MKPETLETIAAQPPELRCRIGAYLRRYGEAETEYLFDERLAIMAETTEVTPQLISLAWRSVVGFN